MNIIYSSDIKKILYDKLIDVCSNVGSIRIDSAFNELVLKSWKAQPYLYYDEGYKGKGDDCRIVLPRRTIELRQYSIYDLGFDLRQPISADKLKHIIDKVFLDNDFANEKITLTILDFVSRLIQRFFNKCIYLVISTFNNKYCFIFVPAKDDKYDFKLTKEILIEPYDIDVQYIKSFKLIITKAIEYLPKENKIILTVKANIL